MGWMEDLRKEVPAHVLTDVDYIWSQRDLFVHNARSVSGLVACVFNITNTATNIESSCAQQMVHAGILVL